MAEIAPLRGRHRELAELDALVGPARDGRSGALVVSGEAGVKTALLDRMAARAVATGRGAGASGRAVRRRWRARAAERAVAHPRRRHADRPGGRPPRPQPPARTDDGHNGRVYDLTGPQALTQADQVAILGRTLGRPLTVEDLDPEPTKKQMGAFMDGAFLSALFGLMAQAADKPAEVNDVVRRVAGHPGRTYQQWTVDHTADFS